MSLLCDTVSDPICPTMGDMQIMVEKKKGLSDVSELMQIVRVIQAAAPQQQ